MEWKPFSTNYLTNLNTTCNTKSRLRFLHFSLLLSFLQQLSTRKKKQILFSNKVTLFWLPTCFCSFFIVKSRNTYATLQNKNGTLLFCEWNLIHQTDVIEIYDNYSPLIHSSLALQSHAGINRSKKKWITCTCAPIQIIRFTVITNWKCLWCSITMSLYIQALMDTVAS